MEVEAVMRAERFQSERGHLLIIPLRIPSGRMRGFSVPSAKGNLGKDHEDRAHAGPVGPYEGDPALLM